MISAPETGTVFGSEDPITEGITFSNLSLYGVSKGQSFLYRVGPQPEDTEQYTPFSGWIRHRFPVQFDPLLPHVTFTVFAPTGYELLANSLAFTVWPESLDTRFIYTGSSSEYAVSQEVSAQVDPFTIPREGASATVPIGYLSGSLSLRALAVPEEASPAGLLAIALAALILVSVLRRSRGGGPSGALR